VALTHHKGMVSSAVLTQRVPVGQRLECHCAEALSQMRKRASVFPGCRLRED
jgi:hypothetical protein